MISEINVFKKMEEMLKEIVAGSMGKSQKGDISKALAEQGFFDNTTGLEALKKRDELP